MDGDHRPMGSRSGALYTRVVLIVWLKRVWRCAESDCPARIWSEQHGPLRTLADVEAITMSYVDWYNNHRLHTLLQLVAPEDFETDHYPRSTGSPTGEAANKKPA